jgi:hypothetical protein
MTPLCMTPPRHLPEMLRPVAVERDPPSQATPGGMNLTKGLRPGPFLQSLLSEGEGGDAYRRGFRDSGAGLCEILHMNFREFLFHALG